ncbi:MAG: glycosyltransferase WbuB [Deltaproteobacteria bacterium GWA2_54_12]|nr:MAG: glycosyltransferase WbuB [Deltaproteobacteria bacterium GWA2_54_12]
MHVLIVTQYFWPEDFRINGLAVGLVEKGHRVTVLTGIPNYPGGKFFPGYGVLSRRRENYRGIEILRVPLVPRGKGQGYSLFLNYLSFALFACAVGPLLCRESYEVIFVYQLSPVTVGLPALVLKKVKGSPILFWVQDLWPESLSATGAVSSQYVLKIVERLVRFIYRGCDQILVQSRGFFQPIQRMGVDLKRIHYFPNSVERFYHPVSLENDAPERAELPGGFRVMFAGNIGAAQDFETILSAAEVLRSHPEIQWVIIGDGRLRAWVGEQVRERGLTDTVHLLGRHPQESMPRYFALTDVLLVTLRKDPIFALTIPSKVQSYLACAKPIVAALDGEGARVVAESGAGLATPAGDANALAEAILEIHKLPNHERSAMGLRGRQYYETHFDRNRLLDSLEAWMMELSKGSLSEATRSGS